MLLKLTIPKQHNLSFFSAVSYRIAIPVRSILYYASGAAYPICPRCAQTLDREYICYCDRCGQHLSWICYDDASIEYAPRR